MSWQPYDGHYTMTTACSTPPRQSPNSGLATLATAHTAGGRIGPNAIIQMAGSLDAFEGRHLTARVFAAASLERYLANPPAAMVDEAEVIALHTQLYKSLTFDRSRSVAWLAGQRTAGYLLANRIPQPVQRVLKVLPPRVAARILMRAIARHSWTFAGSGQFSYKLGNPLTFVMAGSPACRNMTSDAPCCDYYAATFECLFSKLVHAQTRVTETACAATGAQACTFEIDWGHGKPPRHLRR